MGQERGGHNVAQRNIALLLTALGWLILLGVGAYVLWDADFDPQAVAVVAGTLLAVFVRACVR